ncbi:MAG: response regulator [Pseudomonadota bacterium]
MTVLENTVDLGPVRALIVDDNAFDRRRLVRLASETRVDFRVKDVADTQAFAAILDHAQFDVIYVDLDLAGEDGMALMPSVRRHPINKNAAMIMVAGNGQADVALEAVRAGFSDYIEKSALSAASLERATVNALQKIRLTQAANTAEAETKSIEAVLRSFALGCSNEMRPMMARMLRQVRQMRAEADRTGISAAALLDIEQTCARMEEFFQDLGSMANDGELSSIVQNIQSPARNNALQADKPAKQSKRAGLFSR